MTDHPVVSDSEWVEARKALLAKEKEFTRQREELTQLRQQLPWRKVDKEYVFDTQSGEMRLEDLFGQHSQLITYHFMYDSDWKEGCKICSMLGDHYEPLIVHLKARDVALVTVSIAPLEKLNEYRERMGWSFDWVSSNRCDFNRDFGVTFTEEEKAAGTMNYNYRVGSFPVTECPGISSFCKDENGDVFHTYSAYARGLENFLGIYNFLDIVSKGRDESELPYPMFWIRHHDRYDDDAFQDPYVDVDNVQ